MQPADEAAFATPIPTQIVSGDEYVPAALQREVETRLNECGDSAAEKQGISRCDLFQTAAGSTASYYVMNQVYGDVFDATKAEAATPEPAVYSDRMHKDILGAEARR